MFDCECFGLCDWVGCMYGCIYFVWFDVVVVDFYLIVDLVEECEVFVCM